MLHQFSSPAHGGATYTLEGRVFVRAGLVETVSVRLVRLVVRRVVLSARVVSTGPTAPARRAISPLDWWKQEGTTQNRLSGKFNN